MAAQQLAEAECQASSCEARSGTSSDGDGGGSAQVHGLKCVGDGDVAKFVDRMKMISNREVDAVCATRPTRSGRPPSEDTAGSQEFHKMSLSELKAHVETSLKCGIRFSQIAANLRVHRNTLRRYLMKDGSWGGVYDKSPLPDVCDQLREVVPLQDEGACWGIRKCQAALRATNHRVSRRKVRAALYSLDSAALQLRRVKRVKDDCTSTLPTCEGEDDDDDGLLEDDGRSKRSHAGMDQTQSLLHAARTAETGATQCSLLNLVSRRPFGSDHVDMQKSGPVIGFLEQISGSALSGERRDINLADDGHGYDRLNRQARHHGITVVPLGIGDGGMEKSRSMLGSEIRDSLCKSALSENDLLSGSEDAQSDMEAAANSKFSKDDPPLRVGHEAFVRLQSSSQNSERQHLGAQVPQQVQAKSIDKSYVDQFGSEANSERRLFGTSTAVSDRVCQDNRASATEVRRPTAGKDADGIGVSLRKRWFPYVDEFKLNEEEGSLKSREILEKLDSFLVAGRRKKIENVVGNRTYTICIVLESLLDYGNISTVYRSADAFGFQSVHLISNCPKNRYKKQRKTFDGVEKWLDVETWDTSRECLAALRSRGYRIAVTHDAADSVSIYDVDWTVPTAVILGNENRGPSHEAILSSDIRCSIPTLGMEDALIVPVVAGILMQHIVRSRLTQTGVHGDLLPDEQQILAAEFCMRHSR